MEKQKIHPTTILRTLVLILPLFFVFLLQSCSSTAVKGTPVKELASPKEKEDLVLKKEAWERELQKELARIMEL